MYLELQGYGYVWSWSLLPNLFDQGEGVWPKEVKIERTGPRDTSTLEMNTDNVT